LQSKLKTLLWRDWKFLYHTWPYINHQWIWAKPKILMRNILRLG